MKNFDPPISVLLLVVILVVSAAWIRLAGTGWDGFANLHPDERHIMFVTIDMVRGFASAADQSLSFSDLWFSQDQSPLNPRTEGRMYVYGEAPVLIIASLANFLGETDWTGVLELGRMVSALLDASTVLAVFILAFRLSRSSTAAVFSAVLYAAAPTAIQLANFFTVDVWLTAASAWSCVLLLQINTHRNWSGILFSSAGAGALIGFAVACKVTGLVLGLPVLVVLICLTVSRGIIRATFAAIVLLVFLLLTFRIANPFAFVGPGFFGLNPAPLFLESYNALFSVTLSPDFPPNWQWLSGYSMLDLLRDFSMFGTGPALVLGILVSLFGVIFARAKLFQNISHIFILFAGSIAFLGLAATSDVPALRYAAPALPFLAAMASGAFVILPSLISIFLVLFAIWWGSGMVRLHDGRHPRILTSVWIWSLPAGSTIANETVWDEGLPVPVMLPGTDQQRWPGFEDYFHFQNLDITAEDTVAKADRIAETLKISDYVVVSSGRQRDYMPLLPERFTMTAAYYQSLADGSLCFSRVFHIDRNYPLPLFPIDDRWAQEPFRVYDHPIIDVYKRQPCYEAGKVAAYLREVLN